MLLLLAGTFALGAVAITIMNRTIGAGDAAILVAAVASSFAPGIAYLVLAAPVRRLRFRAVAGALALATAQTLLALGLLVHMLYVSSAGLIGFLFAIELTCLVLGVLLAADLLRATAYARTRPGSGFDARLRAGSSARPTPVLQDVGRRAPGW